MLTAACCSRTLGIFRGGKLCLMATALAMPTMAAGQIAPPAAIGTCDAIASPLDGNLIDKADMLDSAQEARITESLVALEGETRRKFVVATVPSLHGMEVWDYAACLFDGWHLGDTAAGGILLLVAPNERRARIELGPGLDALLTDEEAQAIMDDIIIAAFKVSDMVIGIEDGVAAIIREVS